MGRVRGPSYADAPAVFQPPELLKALGFFQGRWVEVGKGFQRAAGECIQADML